MVNLPQLQEGCSCVVPVCLENHLYTALLYGFQIQSAFRKCTKSIANPKASKSFYSVGTSLLLKAYCWVSLTILALAHSGLHRLESLWWVVTFTLDEHLVYS